MEEKLKGKIMKGGWGGGGKKWAGLLFVYLFLFYIFLLCLLYHERGRKIGGREGKEDKGRGRGKRG